MKTSMDSCDLQLYIYTPVVDATNKPSIPLFGTELGVHPIGHRRAAQGISLGVGVGRLRILADCVLLAVSRLLKISSR